MQIANRSLRRLSLLGVAFLFSLGSTLAQGSKEDYERAAKIAGKFSGKVHKASLKAHWFADGTKFWYRNDLRGGEREFIGVDAVAGTRGPAFDHDKLALLLTKELKRPIQSTKLPVDRIEFIEGDIILKGRGKTWRWDLQKNELQSTAPAEDATESTVEILDRPRASRKTGEETSVLFVNRTDQIATLHWVDTSGKPKQYATVDPGKSHRQHTFAGHVWVAKNEQGKLLNAFAAVDHDGVAIVDGKTRPAQKADSRKRPSHSNNSADGRFRTFFKDYNLYLRDLEKKEDFALSNDGTESDRYDGRIWWSPDSKRVVALRTKQGGDRKVYYVESSPKDQLQPKLHSYNYLKPGDEIPQSKPQLFDPLEKKHIPIDDALFSKPWAITQLRWEPDSSAFTFLYNQRGHQVMRVLSVDASTGSVRALVDENPETFFCYSHKTYLKHLPASKELIWMSERDGWNHLYLYDSDTGQAKNPITQGNWVVRDVTKVDEENRQIWFTAGGLIPGQDPYYLHYARVDFDGDNLTLLTEGNGTHSIDFSPNQRFYIDSWSRVDQAPVHELRRSKDGGLVCLLETADISELKDAGWKAPERLVAKGRDGETDIYGIIIRPTNHDPSKSYPILEDIYAGPHSAFVPKGFRAFSNMQSLAELGFIVVKIDGMGTSYRSKAF
ncbi:DPP IV N-terminal domain-containing protein, partial [Haloferula sp.]|uniref:DPP IV N-terminal domain-containing protein n=1 Tax=Haloferula sp. TaxID=2497595 RepID=UPI003C70D801